MLVINRTQRGKAEPLRQAKAAAATQVAAITSKVRQAFVTPITGQELTYQEKERQALAYLALSADPDPADPDARDAFGFIFGEVGITGQTAYQVAQVIAYKAGEMRKFGPMIERLRLQVSADLDAATDEAQVAQIVEFFRADIEALV